MKTIIVATDYSSCAQNALVYAAQLARHTDSNLLLFNAFSLPVPTLEGMMALPDLQGQMAENKVRLEKVARETANTYQLPVQVKCGLPPLVEELEALSSQYEEPLVVVGMRGDSLERKLFGSLTTSIIRNGKYPVLVVPAEARYHDIAKILFACDYDSLSVFNQLNPLKELARTFRSRLQILHVEKAAALLPAEEAVEAKKEVKLEAIFRGIKHTYKEVEMDDVIEGIEKGVAEFNADMLVMVPHKPDFWDNILNRSNTRTMALRTHIPLLALPNPVV